MKTIDEVLAWLDAMNDSVAWTHTAAGNAAKVVREMQADNAKLRAACETFAGIVDLTRPFRNNEINALRAAIAGCRDALAETAQ